MLGESTPLKRATIAVEGRMLSTDENGESKIMVPEGLFHVQASAQGYSSMANDVVVTDNSTVEIQLSLVGSEPTPHPPTPPVVAVEAKRGQNLMFWPNPASDLLYVNVPSASIFAYEVRCATGGCALRGEVKTDGIIPIPIAKLAPGVYLITLIDDSGVVVSARFAVR